jgi:signal transduction histidine kinase
MNLGTDAVRQASIEGLGVLDTLPTRDLQALVELTAHAFNVPTAAINLITSTHQHQIAAAGFEPSVCAREDSMCAAVLEQPTVTVADARLDDRFADNPFVTGEIGDVRFYASSPLVTPDGVTIGRLCVFDGEPRKVTPQEWGAIAVLAGHVTDLLELRRRTLQLESSLAELTRTRDELRRSNEHLAAFAGQVSHDLRTPLTSILAYAELLAEEPVVASDPAAAPLAREVVEASLRMASMIEEVLDYAQVAGQLRLVDTDLEVLVANVLNDLGPVLRRRGATAQVGPLPTVLADAGQLYVVLLNLVDNAAKYSGNGPGEIAIGCDPESEWTRIWVRDSGVGIPADRLEEVFEPFVRVTGSGEHHVQGLGIGLDTVRRIIESHGGRLGIDSVPGGGTTVWFELPARARAGVPSGPSVTNRNTSGRRGQ